VNQLNFIHVQVFAELERSVFHFLENGLGAVPGRMSPRRRSRRSCLFSRCYLVWAFFLNSAHTLPRGFFGSDILKAGHEGQSHESFRGMCMTSLMVTVHVRY